MPKHEALFVSYCAKDFLDGTQSLSPMEELAYRRICDLIYDTGDRLVDDDKRLAWLTKTGKQWPKIKSALVAASGGASGKIYIDQGFIRNLRCSREIEKVTSKREAGRAGGRATQNGPKSANSLANLKQHPKQTPKQKPKHTIEAHSEAIHLTSEPIKEKPILSDGQKESRSRRSQIPPDWLPSPAGYAYALQHAKWDQPTADAHVAHFRDHHRSKANLFADHDAAWRTWVRNSATFHRNGNGATKPDRSQPLSQARWDAMSEDERAQYLPGYVRAF